MMSHIIIRDCNTRGPTDCINKPISAARQGTMINPHVAPAEDWHTITVGYGSPPEVLWGVPHISVPALLTIMYVNTMDDDVGHILYGDAWTVSNVHTSAPTINGLEWVHDQFLLQLNDHVTLEYDPQWLVLDDSMAERPWLRVHGIIVFWVSHNVDLAIPASDSVLTKTYGTIG